jgi:hypothetical protein
MLELDNVKSLGIGVHGDCVCSCEVCKPKIRFASQQSCCVHLSLFNGIIALWMLIFCSKREFDLFHKKVCLMANVRIVGLKN